MKLQGKGVSMLLVVRVRIVELLRIQNKETSSTIVQHKSKWIETCILSKI